MFFKNNLRLQISVLIYIILIIALIFIKPKFFFKKDGTLKTFGTGGNNTILPLWMIILLMAIFSYYIAQIILYANFIKRN